MHLDTTFRGDLLGEYTPQCPFCVRVLVRGQFRSAAVVALFHT